MQVMVPDKLATCAYRLARGTRISRLNTGVIGMDFVIGTMALAVIKPWSI
jgi:hypothetical protein